jgi:hypothetical protein
MANTTRADAEMRSVGTTDREVITMEFEADRSLRRELD